MLKEYLYLMRWHRPIGFLLLLCPMLWALWIASSGHPDYKILIIFILGAFIMRSAGCVINDIADRRFDGHVARTKDRPLARGALTLKQAILLFVILCLVALVLVLQLNLFTIELSLVAILLAMIYPFMKRYTHWPQIFLGAAYAWAIPMAFAAQTNHLPVVAWLVFLTAVLWSIAYDTLYAMVDREDDLKIKLKSTAILFGKHDRLIIGLLQLLILLLLVYLGWHLRLSIIYYGSLVVGAFLFVYQQYLIKDRNRDACFRAFLNNQWFGLIVFLGIYLSYRHP